VKPIARLLPLAAVTLIGILVGELSIRFIPEMVLRKAAAMVFVGMGRLMWFEKP
jgi:putative Ca2+/H+ antiporter (TMEM165/GDT1 family)